MHSLRFDSEYWRGRAGEARTIAEQMAQAALKQRMLRIAADYDQRAKLCEEQANIKEQYNLPDIQPAPG
jgi:hypothetical protein